MWVGSLGFADLGSGFRVWVLGFRVYDLGFRVQGGRSRLQV